MKLNGLFAVNQVVWVAVWATIWAVEPISAEAQQTRPARSGPTTLSGGSSRGGRGNNVQQAQLNRIKELLAASDEEWKILEPRILTIQDLLRDSGARGGIASGRGRRGGFGGTAVADPENPPTAVQNAARELQESLASKDASAEDIKSKLTALRDARVKSQTELAKAQDQLREVLTARQEAVLVMSGLLN